MTNLLKARQVAEYLCVPYREFLAMVEAGQGPVCILLPSGRRRWRLADVDAWVACHAVSVPAAAAAVATPVPVPPEPAPVPSLNCCSGTTVPETLHNLDCLSRDNQGFRGGQAAQDAGTSAAGENIQEENQSASTDAVGALADQLSEQSLEILQALPEDRTWLKTPSVARRVSPDISPRSGRFRSKIKQLSEKGLIESSNNGLRLTAVGFAVRVRFESEPP
ncbi:helix-turn-helix transcriptional regulator [Tuwongella immobilis]|uniref:Helix-turn-helix domain-containing protein n=1 Tax=Tuwongella immobilis TaxID=692036 RepID=A0A6C2YXP2_9BACT|nr:hypothetical protein [Tuwongella immobilis]VIP05572.1 unnamed protein product [Tuwongella immobilis]VTS08499.1 unnamed protein product [Tuwongella immobilis]